MFELVPEILVVLEPRSEPSPGGRRKKAGPAREKAPTKAAPAPTREKKKRGRSDPDPELSEEDPTRDTFAGDDIALDELVREFILLEIPLNPRRSDLPSSEEGLSSRPLAGPDASRPVDPRLKPLQTMLERMRGRGQ
jgi:hypothetical protein